MKLSPPSTGRSYAVVVTLAAFAATACIQGKRVIRVNADGSGTLVDTFKLSEEAAAMASGLEAMDESAEEESPEQKKAKEEAKYKELAGSMGLEFASLEKVGESERVSYTFKNVGALKVGVFPTMASESEPGKDPIGIRFERSGGKSKLTLAPSVAVLEGKEPEAPPADVEEQSPEEIAREIKMMKGIMGGLSIELVVEVVGKLIESTSPHTQGNSVTVMALDFDKLDEATLLKMAGKEQPDFTKFADAMGIKVAKGPVTITFSE